MYTQIFIDGTNVTPQTMKRAEQVTEPMGGLVVSPFGEPVKNERGEYEVRFVNPNPMRVRLARRALESHCGLRVTRVEDIQEG